MPIENNDLGGISALSKSLGNLPLGLGNSLSGSAATTDLFTTIVYSRSNLENIIHKFDLMSEYKTKKMEETRKILAGNIRADETDEGAYSIAVKSKDPQKAADMANYIVSLLNERVIEMNITKSKSNKEFLENRYAEIKLNLNNAEEQLKKYQQNSKIIEAESQVKALMEEYIRMESDLEKKRIDYSILLKSYGENNPQVQAAKGTLEEYEKMVKKVKDSGLDNSFFVSAKNLPEESMNYFRLLRNVEINNEMLTYIVPMYEKAKFEEQNNMPVIQIIDKAVPPEKRVYPQRILMAFLISSCVSIFVIFLILTREIIAQSSNEKLKKIFE
jgi:capsule polysaccharide export protein KpsE/RkpR